LYLSASKKLTFQEKKYPDPKRIFTAEKKGRFGGFDNQRIKSDSQNPKEKT